MAAALLDVNLFATGAAAWIGRNFVASKRILKPHYNAKQTFVHLKQRYFYWHFSLTLLCDKRQFDVTFDTNINLPTFVPQWNAKVCRLSFCVCRWFFLWICSSWDSASNVTSAARFYTSTISFATQHSTYPEPRGREADLQHHAAHQ